VNLPPEPKKKNFLVAEMFDRIAGRYDFLNRFFSAGTDVYWRKKAIHMLDLRPGFHLLDVAAGTADLSLEACRQCNPIFVTGVDISEGMLALGQKKIDKAGLSDAITLQVAAAENLPFQEGTFDAVMAAFGVRNFESLTSGLSEMLRVVKPGGKVMILEFSRPSRGLFRLCFDFYFRRIMPVLGRWVSSDQNAYTYLPDTVLNFPCGADFLSILEQCGYSCLNARPLTMGLVTIYTGMKPDESSLH
jgi:demethylmenaquinone methyltransferase/2-methoxy-6-polyprenyl-1,4-benzoquinol methylase